MKDKKTLLILIPFLLFVIIVGALAILGAFVERDAMSSGL